jgi:hypothetical protein
MNMFHKFFPRLIAVCLLSAGLSADEGLWLFNRFPASAVKAKYGFAVTPEWLDHYRLSCLNMGGSASFVSPDGLLVTNHHVGAGAIHRLGSKDRDLMKTGFYAKTTAEELKCPGLEARVLRDIEDVTDRVRAAAEPGLSAAEASRAMSAVIAKIEKESEAATGLRSEVVKLYAGGMYHLYRYKTFNDLRLVFAPEQQITFFGGDPDNYGYPRYDLDVAFFRVYENGKPYRPPHHLEWNTTGLTEGELVFAAGNPERTSRLLTLSQLEFLRGVSYPLIIDMYVGQKDALTAFSDKGAEEARVAFRSLWVALNEIKCFRGQMGGLTDPALMAEKARAEKSLRETIRGNPGLEKTYGRIWEEIAGAQKNFAEFYAPYTLLAEGQGLDSVFIRTARAILQMGPSPAAANIEKFEKNYFSAPVNSEFEIARLTASLKLMASHMSGSAELNAILRGRTPDAAARDLVSGTKLGDLQAARALIQGGPEKWKESADPIVKLVLSLEPIVEALNRRYRDEVLAVEIRNGALISKALFDLKGASIPPDATHTLRISFGVVKGYEENGKAVPFQTVYKGLYERAERFGYEFPFNLPQSVIDARPRVNMDAPYNFVATCDSSGGNSGSPLVNTKGEFIGILFDGNAQSLPARFLYTDTQARSVMVHAGGILEALKNIYGAGELVRELLK